MKRIFVLLMATISAVLLSSTAFAQIPAAPTYTGFEAIMNGIINTTPGVNSHVVSGIQDGVTLRTTGNVTVNASNGLRIPVPVTAQATIGKAAMAKAAAKLVGGASILGAAYQTYEVYNWIKESGISTCAPPDFFCKPATGGSTVNSGWAYGGQPAGGGTMDQAANLACADVGSGISWNGTNTNTRISGNSEFTDVKCKNGTGQVVATMTINRSTSYQCPAGSTKNSSGQCVTASTSSSPYTQQELESGLIGTGTNWDPARSQKMRDAILADNAKQKLLTQEDITPAASPLTVDKPATVSAPPITTKTETFKNPDGTTTTRTTTETTTVSPTAPAPSTVGSPVAPKFETQTKTEVTDRNDTTGVVTPVSTTISNSVPATTAPQQLQIPDDYAREPTLQKIERSLNTDTAPEMPDQAKRVTEAETKANDDLKALRDAVATAQNADKSLWFSWVWTPPVGECQPGRAVLTGGALVAWDICPTVNNIKGVLGWLMALFGAWSIYGEIFRRND